MKVGFNTVGLVELIRSRTHGRVSDADVQIEGMNGDTTVILKGQSSSYYVQSLAQEALKRAETLPPHFE